MDFGEFLRGGTAPTGKSKLSANLNPSSVHRPKTRAVDADIQDTNLDLRMNKNISPFSPDQGSEELISEKEFARIHLNDWNDKNEGGASKRAPSRGKKSKDPLRTQNPLTSGLSAYTQNMPNIVLNTNRKSHKSSSPRPTSTKEHRTISQINELKAAYGADIPIGKQPAPSSPGKPKPQPTGSKFESVPTTRDGPGRLTLKDPTTREMKKVNSMDNNSVGSSIASSAMEFGERGGGKEKEREKDLTPSARSTSSDVSSPNSPHRKSIKKNNLLKISFTSKQSDESLGDHLNSYNAVKTRERERDREENDRERNTHVSAPSPEPTDLIPVEEFFRDVMQPRPNNSNRTEREEKKLLSKDEKKPSFRGRERLDSNTSNNSGGREQENAKNMISFSLSDNSMNVPNILLNPQQVNEDVFVNLRDSQRNMSNLVNKEKQQRMTDENLEIVDDEEGFYGFIEDDKEYSTDNIEIMEKFQKEYKDSQQHGQNSLSQNTSKATTNNHAIIHSAPQTVSKNNLKNAQYQQQQEEVVVEESARPQSRKLYLGSESTKASTLDSNNNQQRNTPKGVPKSAGARYGDYSPMKGGVDDSLQNEGGSSSPKATSSKSPRVKKGQFKKLNSHGDLDQWIEGAATAESTTMRPPSRQSTAFPVHLTNNEQSNNNDTEKSSANDNLAPTTSSISIISGTVTTSAAIPSATKRQQQDYSMQMMKQQPQQSLMLNTDDLINNNQDYSSSAPRTRQNFAVNTEPRSVKKQPSMEETPVDAYDKRPPSRQKIAAQHLFDDGSDQNEDAVTITSRRSSSGRPDTRKGSETIELPSNSMTALSYDSRMKTPGTTSSGGGPRPLSTRGHHLPQPNNDDGFAELDGDDPVAPFPITMNSNNNTNSNSNNNYFEGPLKSEFRHPPLSNNPRSSGGGDDYEFEFYSPPSINNPGNMKSSSNRRAGGGGGSPRNSNNMDNPEYSSSHRPSSVTGIHHNNGNSHFNAATNSAKSPYNYYDMKQEENNTLRSKSANNYTHGHRLYNPVHTDHVNNTTNFINNSQPSQPPAGHLHPNKPSKPASGRNQPDSKRTRAWGDEPDPRHLPRAQVTTLYHNLCFVISFL
jgi:hypothetical protein